MSRMSSIVDRKILRLIFHAHFPLVSLKPKTKKREMGLTGETPDAKQIASLTEAVVQFIFSEANRVLLGYQKKFNKNVSKVVLTGGGATLKGILVAARSTLETEVILADPFSKVEAPAFLEPVLKSAGPEFAVALGIALRRLSEIE